MSGIQSIVQIFDVQVNSEARSKVSEIIWVPCPP